MIKIVRLGQPVQEVSLNGHRTAGALLNSCGVYPASNEEIRVNNVPGNADSRLNDGDSIQLIPNVKAG